jgi:wyosine [tRNA(Phe)-imidazoG37] synthetase (radical SAM superfamily)
MRVERGPFYPPEEIAEAVRRRVESVRATNESIDYVTFVPDGEPTLDVNLGRTIDLLRPLGLKTAIITNSSLMWRADVRADLLKLDLVSVGVDAARYEPWHRVNRPHGRLQLDGVLDGLQTFANAYEGKLISETMLVRGVNDSEENVTAVARFLGQLKPARAYLAVPTRPPAEAWVCAPSEAVINRAYQIFSDRLDRVEYLIGYEGAELSSTGDVVEDLLSITAVHPMRADAVRDLVARAGADWSTVDGLVDRQRLVATRHGGRTFYLRKLAVRGS